MKTAPRYVSAAELEEIMCDVLASPKDEGALEAIVIRPATNERRSLPSVAVTPERGVDGDRWFNEPYKRLDDGQPNPEDQVSLMNARILRQIAVEEGAMCLAGDNLIVDMDLSTENLPAGTRLAIGGAVLEMTAAPHTGCGKFQHRYGVEAKAFINSPRGKVLNLRGRYARVITAGTIAVGDIVRKL